MKKRIMPLFMLAALLSLLSTYISGCGGTHSADNGVDEFTPPPGYDVSYSITKEFIGNSEKGLYKVRNFNNNTWFGRISVYLWSAYVSESVNSGDFYNPYYLYVINTSYWDDGWDDFSFQSVIKGIDQLAVIGYTSVSYTPIIEMDYTIPYKIAIGTKENYKSTIGYLIGSGNEYFEEINGQQPGAYKNRLSDYYNVLRAKKGETFNFSYYSGTQYLQETIIADHIYYIVEGGPYKSLPITKTTDGYFWVDYSEMSSGFYLFNIDGNKMIVEIK